MNYDTNIIALIISHDLENGNTFILNNQDLEIDLPTIKYEHTTDSKIFTFVSSLILSYYDVNINWSKIKLIDVECYNGGINIYYAMTFPFEYSSILKRGKFVPIELFDNHPVIRRVRYLI
jgi:hypothetical protein